MFFEKLLQSNNADREIESNYNNELLQENQYYNQMMSRICGWTYNLKTKEIFFTHQIYQIFGFNADELDEKFKNFSHIIHPDDLDKVRNVTEKAISVDEFEIEYRIVSEDQKVKHIYEKFKTLYDVSGDASKIVGVIQDITGYKQPDSDAKESGADSHTHKNKKTSVKGKEEGHPTGSADKKFEVLIQEANDVYVILSPEGIIQFMSEAASRVIGYRPEEQVGKKIYDYYQGTDLVELAKMINSVLEEPRKKVTGELKFINKANEEVWLLMHMQNLLDEPAVGGIAISFRDITQRVKMEERISYIATHDEITKLPNRLALKKELETICASGRKGNFSLALMMLDIDGFKYYNDALGYEVGDKLIVKVAERLSSNLSKNELLYRYSADRFVVIVKAKSLEEYQSIARTIIALFEQPFSAANYDLNVIVNVGISICYANEQHTYEQMIKNAEIALIWARKSKHKFKFYSSDISIQDFKHFSLRNDLKNAITKNQLMVFYQPIVRLDSNELYAAEALLRWQHPEWGLVSPREFIELAEETGYITEIGNWLLREVCRTYKNWLAKNFKPIKISVNFSSIQLLESNFSENIIAIINEFELDPEFLIMEITESVLVDKSHATSYSLQTLKNHGIQIALDDFGTGYSSLAYLHSFNLDILKLDSAFIKNIGKDNISTVITKNVIKMAQELDLKLVAEGIETVEQLNFLRELNCFSGQGYIYSKPMPLHDFEKVLASMTLSPETAANTEVISHEERRKYYRLYFKNPLAADLTIKEIKGKNIDVGNSKVLISNISASGLGFVSNLRLPSGRDIILQFVTQIDSTIIKIKGYVVWSNEAGNDLFNYGVEFIIGEQERKDLLDLLDRVKAKMEKDNTLPEGNFVSSTEAFFK